MVDKLLGPENLAASESFSVTGHQTKPPDFWSSVSLCDIILLTTVFSIYHQLKRPGFRQTLNQKQWNLKNLEKNI